MNKGDLHLTYEPLRFMDYHTIDGSGIPAEPFNTTPSRSGLRLPDLGDIYLPYLQFNYTFNGLHPPTCNAHGVFSEQISTPRESPSRISAFYAWVWFPKQLFGIFLTLFTTCFSGLPEGSLEIWSLWWDVRSSP